MHTNPRGRHPTNGMFKRFIVFWGSRSEKRADLQVLRTRILKIRSLKHSQPPFDHPRY